MPSESIVTGSVNNTKNGFINAFKNESTIANKIACRYPSTFTPGSIQAAKKTARLDIIIL